ncbi:FAD-dependent monooxygenase [Streptomyces sp. NPDC049954]|uniref:FAD-dependent monooxygenase n=1 Tax=Streptomyces sp. NPDC049954 TaxID=3155779 RepID=UPI0034262D02
MPIGEPVADPPRTGSQGPRRAAQAGRGPDPPRADRGQVPRGRVHFAGDAAHRHPPTGGLGLTSAIHDVHSLSWELAAVLAGRAGEALLDTYDAERRPVDQNNIDKSIANALNHLSVDRALNLSPDRSPEDNWAGLAPCGRTAPTRPPSGTRSAGRSSRGASSSTTTTSSPATATSPPRSCPTAPRPPYRSTRSPSTSPVPGPVTR